MAWHTGKPADGDLLSVSAQYIRENFAELEPLQPHVAELVDLTALQPYVAELVDLTALQPHIAALLDSRIVEMGSNSNGTYVRWENGLQLCYVRIGDFGPIDRPWGTLYAGPSDGRQWTFPAAFVSIPVVVAFAGSTNNRAAIAYQDNVSITQSSVNLNLARGTADDLTNFVIAAIAIGTWK